MSYENLKEAREKRAAKEAAAGSEGHSRKRKSLAAAEAKVKRVRRSEVEVAEDEIAAACLGDHCSVLQFQVTT
jgi:hypothetical protein